MFLPNYVYYYELAILYLQKKKHLFSTEELENIMKFAIELRWIRLLIILYSDGVGVTLQNEDNETILFSAIRNNYRIFIDIAINNKYDLNQVNSNGDTLLHTAIKFNKLDMAEILLRENVHFNIANNDKMTPLLLMESGIIPSTSPNFYNVLNILHVKIDYDLFK